MNPLALACLFTAPALTGEFLPMSLWHGTELDWGLPSPRRSGRSLSTCFADAVADLGADAEVVGVKLSGGLDSLAVLAQVAALRPARRIVAYTVDLTDDRGVSTVTAARGLLAGLDVPVELVVVPSAGGTIEPLWSPHGPRFDALPAANAATAAFAEAAGVDVLLSGDGADELLGVPRFATASLLCHQGPRAARRYLADGRRAGPGAAGEALAVAARLLPLSVRARLYWATNWPDVCEPVVADVVPEPLRPAAQDWAAQWIDTAIAAHRGRSWVEADAADSFWPRAYLAPAGAVPEGSPFLHAGFVREALALPLHARYDPTAATAYWRCKAAVVRLLPDPVRVIAPTRKQYFTKALEKSASAGFATPVAETAGVIDPQRLARSGDTRVRMMAAAVEQWLAGAVARGARVPGVGELAS